MKKNTIHFLMLGIVASFVNPIAAQYPSVPKEVQEETAAMMKEAQRKSDIAWEKAKPIIDADARRGKPFIPWAARPTDLPQADIAAFPGAEGGGKYSFGGRGGKVYVVTNLNDEGEGSFRWACEQGGARIIVFNVAGIIRLQSPVIIRAPYITIQGQSAPGDGVCIANESIWINTHDVIIRYMRFRRGITNVGRRDDAIGGNPIGNIMIDHVSASWGGDENMSMYRHMYNDSTGKTEEKLGTVNITIQNSIFAEALDTWNHSFGSTLGGENCTFMRNLWANNTGRNPSIGWNGIFNFANNVMFNWVHRSIDGGDYTASYNIINNYFKPGPLTPKDDPVGYRILKPESGRSKLAYRVYGRAHVSGNIVEGNQKVTANNWDGGVQVEDEKDAGQYTEYIRVSKPLPMPAITIMSAKEAYSYVLDNAGATLPKRDPVDQRITEQVRTGKIKYLENVKLPETQFKHRRLPVDSYKQGIITDISQVGGYPEYKGTPYKDSDNDGMPDEWETKKGLNPKDASDASLDKDKNGYTNIEDYLNAVAASGAPSTSQQLKDNNKEKDYVMKRLLLIGTIVLAGINSLAQYPTIPKAMEDSAAKEMEKVKKLSDEAWEKALPIIQADEKKGKPYVPWAAKPEDLLQAKIPAFPGAEGGGAFSFGGRGGKVYVVTTLADSGPGSFREACEQGGARIVVFNVAGIIELKTPVDIRAPYITIAGQSAPGDGVCIAGESVLINTHDVVIRYMRFRRGATEVTRRDDALGGNAVGNIIIDHVSASWGLDENMSMYRHVYDRGGAKQEKLPTVNVTIQNSIFSECLDTYNHSFGSTIGGLNSTFMRNLWANNISRNPSIGMYGDFGFVNNVIFNWWNRSADGGDHRSLFNFINNYYKPGPITPKDKPIAYRILKPEGSREKGKETEFGKAYVNGNIVEGFDEVTADNWAGGVQVGDNSGGAGNYEQAIRVNQPLPMAEVTILPAKQAYDYVLENVGANLPKRDAVDARIVKEVRTGKIVYNENGQTGIGKQFIKRRLPEDSYKQGIITHPSQVGGYPEYKGTPYKDADKDGMPDEWETKNGLNPKNAADASLDKNNDGYTNIEEYLNSLVDIKKVTPGKAI